MDRKFAVLGGLGWVAGTVAGSFMAPGGVAARIVNDVLPHLDDIASWLAIASAVGVVQIIRHAPDGIAAMWSRGPVGRRLARFRFPPGIASAPADDERPPRRPPAALTVTGITVRFGGVLAVDDVSFGVGPGEVVGLIGPNGAGKTTLLDVVTGFTRPDHGTVQLGGTDVGRWAPERRARQGMARSWQAVELFEEMTVRENLLVGCERHERRRYLTDLLRPGRQGLTATALEIVEDLGLDAVLDQRPSSLPQGNARLVGIARAIVGEPAVLLLDEPAAGLGSDESAELAAVIRMIAERHGIGILVVEHDVPLLLGICDRIVALDFGRKIAEGTPTEISSDEHVVRSYLGDQAPHEGPEGAQRPEPEDDLVEAT